jgi:signal transduction histidine kinase
MIDVPSNWDEEVRLLKKRIKERLQMSSEKIIEEEILNILGRVKILKFRDLKDETYSWIIDSSENKND